MPRTVTWINMMAHRRPLTRSGMERSGVCCAQDSPELDGSRIMASSCDGGGQAHYACSRKICREKWGLPLSSHVVCPVARQRGSQSNQIDKRLTLQSILLEGGPRSDWSIRPMGGRSRRHWRVVIGTEVSFIIQAQLNEPIEKGR